MQVEVKVLLKSQRDFDVVLAAQPREHLLKCERDTDVFFDTVGGAAPSALQNADVVLRLRTVAPLALDAPSILQLGSGGGDVAVAAAAAAVVESASLVLKENATVEDGSQMSWQAEQPVSPAAVAAIVANPALALFGAESPLRSGPVVQRLLAKFGAPEAGSPLASLARIGGFVTDRRTIAWPGAKSQQPGGLTLRLDQTLFPFGARFELEIPRITVPVQDVAEEISATLGALGVAFEFGHESKFSRFVRGAATAAARSRMVNEVKMLLASREDYDRLVAALRATPESTPQQFVASPHGGGDGGGSGVVVQENTFYDGFDNELRAAGAFLRLRREGDKKFTLTLKEHQGASEGSQLNWARETALPVDVARAVLADPTAALLSRESAQSNAVAAALLNIKNSRGAPVFRSAEEGGRLRVLGSFTTERMSFAWLSSKAQPTPVPYAALVLRVDRTVFPSGEHFELEVANVQVPVHDVVDECAAVLTGLGIRFAVGERSKLDCFLDGVA